MTDDNALHCEAAAYARANAAEERARKLEAELELIRAQLVEAGEEINTLIGAGDAMRFSMPLAALAGKSAWDEARKLPAVRRVLWAEVAAR